MNQNESYNRHFPELDGIRGMAISFILIFHCMPFKGIPIDSAAFMLKNSMWIGVDLFFVLSGFLITRILMGLKEQNKKYLVFYGRRALRIFPLYYFSLVFVFFVLTNNQEIKYILTYAAPKQWFFLYGYNIYIMIKNSFSISDYLNHFWSLCVEEQFYLFWPFLIFSFTSKKLPYVMLSAVLISILSKIFLYLMGMNWPVIFSNTIARMDCFAFGGLAAYGYINWNNSNFNQRIKTLFFVSIVVLVVYGVVEKGIRLDSFFTQVLITPVIAVFFSSFIYLIINGYFKFLQWLFFLKWLRLLGKYSYGIYVYHWLLFITLVRLDIFKLNIKNAWLEFLLLLIVTISVSVMSYHVLELPFLKMKRYLDT